MHLIALFGAALAGFANADDAAVTTIEPSVIESLDAAEPSAEAVPEPNTFGVICVGVAAMIYARRWRRR